MKLHHREVVRLDGDRMEAIFGEFGIDRGELMICAAMEDIAGLLSASDVDWRTGDLDRLSGHAERLFDAAMPVGMIALARVARDVDELCRRHDAAALAAAVARLGRVGQQSLLAVWEERDLML